MIQCKDMADGRKNLQKHNVKLGMSVGAKAKGTLCIKFINMLIETEQYSYYCFQVYVK